MEQKIDAHWKSRLCALLSQTNPDILNKIPFKPSRKIMVAAQLIKTNNTNMPKIILVNNEDKQHQFDLNVDSKTYQSKGNWIWVKQLKLYYPDELLLEIHLNSRVIDIPYAISGSVCAHSLLKYVNTDLITHLQSNYKHI